MPIVPYGGATSIEGHTLAPHGGVCIDMSLMTVILRNIINNHIIVNVHYYMELKSL